VVRSCVNSVNHEDDTRTGPAGRWHRGTTSLAAAGTRGCAAHDHSLGL